ncbi:MAG: pantoate--beta-alanine ligase [Candidatus Omnitrophica bacterium]|nr:pantoate--beta-alanine ligase [Candidatus Omnitrophota bacterium]
MKIFKTALSLRSYILEHKRQNKTIGFVPTMGCLHAGHFSLIRRACKENDLVVLSIFVNPIQFGPREDYKSYPRNFSRDLYYARKYGVDVLYYPSVKEIYKKDFSTYIDIEGLSSKLCGKSRPGHFKGVATVCAKLFSATLPDIAYFGRKDLQQAVIIKRMVRDLGIPVRIKVLPIVRERSGLAMSSRNIYLKPERREQAAKIYHALQEANNVFKKGCTDVSAVKSLVRDKLKKITGSKIDYIEIVDLKNLQPLNKVHPGSALVVALWVDKVRLIDNIIF